MPMSTGSSVDSLHTALELSERPLLSHNQHNREDEDDVKIPMRSRSATVVSHQAVINVDQNEAEQWLQKRIGCQFSIK